MIDRRDNSLVSAIHNIPKPIGIVLDQRGVALRDRSFWSEQKHCDSDLQKRDGKSREQRRNEPWQVTHK